MSWFGTNTFDETVERATSELLPAGQEDMALYLEICDQVRSKQVAPKDAARALRKRIGHKNPNVQLLALKLTDSVVKNGGHHFLVQLASKEFIQEMESIIRQPATNAEVKSRSLGYLQSWALAFEGKRDLSYVAETVNRLKADHFIFPETHGQSIMIDTAAPPDWTDSDVCMRCRTGFSMTNRKHHCRNCGQTFCRTCSSKNIPLPRLGINQEVRVCDGCYAKDWAKKNLTDSSSTASLNAIKSTPSSSSLSTSLNSTPPIPPADEEDEDLRRAIEASLKESGYRTNYSGDGGGGGGRGGYVPPQKSVSKPSAQPSKSEDEDHDLAAAIAASLRETSISNSVSASQSYGNASGYSYASSTPKSTASNDLSNVEKENISMFSDLVKRIHEMGGDVTGDRQVQNLYEQIGALQPKLVRSLEDAIGKHRTFIDLHEQISRAVKTYDRLLEERLSNAYASRANPQSQPVYGDPQNDIRSSSYLALGTHSGTSTPPSMYPTTYPDAAPVGSASAPYPYGTSSRTFSSHPEPSQPAVTGYHVPPPPQSQPPLHQQQHIPQQPQVHGIVPATSQSPYAAVPSSSVATLPQWQSQPQYGGGYYDASQQPSYNSADSYPNYAQSQQLYQNQQAPPQQQHQHYQYPHPAQQYSHDQQPQPQQQQQQQHVEPKKEDTPLIEF